MIVFHRHPLAALIALALAAPLSAAATGTPLAQGGTEHGRVVQNGAGIPNPVPPSSEHVQTLESGGARLGSSVQRGDDVHCIVPGVPMTASSSLPFVVSVDGTPADGQAANDADRQRCTDVALAGDAVQVRYDPMVAKPMLDAWTAADGGVRGEPVRFRSWSNYTGWITRAEIRVFRRGANTQETPLAVIPVTAGGDAWWTAPADAPADLIYVLRVLDAKGRFDETRAKMLTLVDYRTGHDDLGTPEQEALTGYGEDSRDVANIPVHGAAVTVNGHVAQEGARVQVMNAAIPVGRDGKFVTQQILPPGDRMIDVSVGERTYRRSVRLPERDWFYVGVIDMTASHGSASANATVVDPSLRNEVKRSAIDGRLAFYTKGTLENGWKLTASADTREQPLHDLFSNFASKDPRYLLRRIDPDQYYPVYGDDSTAVDDAPTQGKFYVRVEKNDSQFMWGNFLTSWTGSELVQYSRGLYGANALWKSQDATSLGERRSTLNAFAADPGTVASREEFRGTGGSLYYLQRQDITTGSERVWVEIRDRDSGLVLQRTLLVPGSDYDLNYLQGRILLRAPLSSMADGAGLVQVGSLSGNPAYLVVNYEYVPGVTELDTFATGARGEHWFNDHLRIGATSYHQGGEGTDQNLGGIDATLRYKPGTFLRMEAARSKGEGNSTLNSIDGGFNFQNVNGQGNQPYVRNGDDKAYAGRIDAALSLADVSQGMRGTLGAYWQDRQNGFSAPGQITLGGEGARQVGAHAEIPFGKASEMNLKADRTDALSQDRNSAEAALKHQFDPHWSGSFGLRAEDRGVADTALIVSPTLAEHGKRTDGIVRVDYQSLLTDTDKPASAPATLDAWNAYGFVQQTLSRTGTRSDNDRVGLGGGWQVTERMHADAEVSDGDGGVGGKLGGDYRISDRSNVYAQYLMETDRPDLAYRGRFGTLVGGARTRLNDRVSVYEETRETTGSGQDSLVHAFGVDMTVNDRWTTGFKLEEGTITDPLAGDLRRQAASVSLAYKGPITKWASSLEYRYEDSNVSGRRTSWLTRNTLGSQLTPAWRLLGKLDVARSGSSNGVFFDGNYTEGVIGAAYRPVDNDRWNTLFKYTYMYDLPSPGQLSPSSGIGPVSTDPGGNLYASTVADYSQKSQVLSVDTIWDVTRWLSVGAKFGYRWGSLKPTRTAGDWMDSTATLWVIRGEWKFVRNWSGLVEWRRLRAREAGDARQGALVGVYRYVTRHVKVGVGYNFTRFSDDMTNLNYDSRGVFLNVLSTF